MKSMRRVLTIVGCAITFLGGCQSQHPSGVAPLQHVVLFDLKDPSEARQIMMDSGQLMQIPGVRSVITGPPIDLGRGHVTTDFDAGLVVSFESAAAYREYLDHPVHKALFEKWHARWDSIRVIDFGCVCDAPPRQSAQ